jgi:DNA-binding response OmpR family regulator
VLRRVEDAAHGAVFRHGGLQLDQSARRVHRDGGEVHLTPIEFDLLAHLLARPGVVFAREQLLADVWGYSDGAGPRTVDSHVRSLRRKLGDDVIRTVHGIGYALGLDQAGDGDGDVDRDGDEHEGNP